MSDVAFRIGAAEHPALARTLRGQLEARRAELVGQLLHSLDWADFNKRKGRVEGLTDAINSCADAEADMRGDH